MKSFFTFGVLLLCLAAIQTAHAVEDRNAQIKAEMVQNYLLWEIALKNNDAGRIISFESPDYTIVMPDGEVRPKSVADHTVYYWTNGKKIHDAKVEIRRLTIEPQRVIVLGIRSFDAKRIGPGEGSERASVTTLSRDIWVNYDGAWMLKRTEIVSTKFLINGKIAR